MRRLAVTLAVVCLILGCDEKEEKAPVEKPTPSAPKLNRLAEEKSPYLLQHATNPVDWYPWGEEAFAKAKKEDKPVFLSIGYSSCHWCHVMEHESFDDAEVAALMNKLFVCIKVDREERPDVDEVYMNAAQVLMRGGGGWPLSVWLNHEKRPFAAGTYFPKNADPRLGRPGFMDVLAQIHKAWTDPDTRKKIDAHGEQIAKIVQEGIYDAAESAPFSAELLKKVRASYTEGYDKEYGGFGGPPLWQPKFPSPSSLEFLMLTGLRGDDKLAAMMATQTLDRMARGGIHDHIGGGFHRYSVTRNWLVPHFEKMLYDNAQLLGLYAWAHRLYGKELYARTARDIALWVRREMTHENGGFYSAQDADDPGGPEGEGGFYIWNQAEIAALFPDKKEQKALQLWFDIGEQGNWFVQGEQENPGKSILQVRRELEDVAKAAELTEDQVTALIKRAKETMYPVREKRPKPMTDKKVLSGWNGLMISGLCVGYQTLGGEDMLAAAVKAGGFIRSTLTKDGRLLRRWAGGEAKFDAVAADYAYVVAAYLDLYESTFDPAWLEAAFALDAKATELFHDAEHGGYYFTAHDGEELFARGKSGFDNARPSANAVFARNLYRLAELTGKKEYRAQADQTLTYFGARVEAQPLGFSALLNAYLFFEGGPREIFIAGGRAEAQPLIEAVWRNPDPRRVVVLVVPGLEKLLPPAEGKTTVDGKPAAYVCKNFTCDAPTTDPADLAPR